MIGQTAVLSELNHKTNLMLRLLQYAWIYMWICFQCFRGFDYFHGLFAKAKSIAV